MMKIITTILFALFTPTVFTIPEKLSVPIVLKQENTWTREELSRANTAKTLKTP